MTPLVSQRHVPVKQWPQFCSFFFFFSIPFRYFFFLGVGDAESSTEYADTQMVLYSRVICTR